MWSYTKITSRQVENIIEVVIKYTDSETGDSFERTYRSTHLEGLKGSIKADFEQLQRVGEIKDQIDAMPNDNFDLTPTPVAETRPAGEIAFANGVEILRAYQESLKLGIRTDASIAHPSARTIAQLKADLSNALNTNPGWIKYVD